MSVRCSGPPAPVKSSGLDPVWLAARAEELLRILRCNRSELSIKLADDGEMAALNGAWRGQAHPTDVLSFSLAEGDHSEYRGRLLGDVVIGIEAAVRQARERHRSLEEVVTRLLIHGILHLLGYDHASDEEARRMRDEERRVWRVTRS